MRKNITFLVLASMLMLTNCSHKNDAEEYADFEMREELTAVFDFANNTSNAGEVVVVCASGLNNYEVNVEIGIETNMPLIKTRSEAIDDSWTYYGEINMSIFAFNKAWKVIEETYGSSTFLVRVVPVEGSGKRKIYHKAA